MLESLAIFGVLALVVFCVHMGKKYGKAEALEQKEKDMKDVRQIHDRYSRDDDYAKRVREHFSE